MVHTISSNVDDVDLEGGGGSHKTSSPPGLSRTKSDPIPTASNQAAPDNGNPEPSSSDPPRMIGDFDGNSNALWTLYGKEAKSHDKARIETLKDDMDGVLIFAGLFSAVLTAFIIDSKQNLKVNPQDKMVYYLQENVVMLYQISQQISSIAPQFPINSTLPASFSAPNLSASDMRVNVFWFMSLVFSLSAALLATLVQQWVRGYMHVFQRYSDPLKSARLRQYLHEGSRKWYMHPVAEAVPALLHVSLFLFFIGLCDFVFHINTTIGRTTTFPIAIIGFSYILTTVAPVINPQSPYQNSFSSLIWYMIQKIGRLPFKNRGPDGASKSVITNMAQRRMRFAMDVAKDREGRDKRAIRWLVSDMTEDAEMESLVTAIPGSFNGPWGEEVWKKVLDTDEKIERPSLIQNVLRWITSLVRTSTCSDAHANTAVSSSPIHQPDATPHSAIHIQGEDTKSELGERVAHLLGTCKNQGHFTSNERWRRRTRACVETTSSLFSCTGAMSDQIGDMLPLLGDLGRSEKIRKLSLEGRDESFVMHWTCLSLMAIQPILKSTSSLHNDARQASRGLERRDNTGETRLEKIIKAFNNASSCLVLFAGLPVLGETEDRVKQTLRERVSLISKLEEIDIESAELRLDDWSISSVQQSIDRITNEVITRQLPGVKSDISDTESDDISHFVELYRDPRTLLFISPLRNLRRIRSFAQTVRSVLQEQKQKDDTLQKFQKTIKDLREIEFPRQSDTLFHRQMWRLLDLQDGGLGFIVELFLLALKQLLSKTPSKESHSALYLGTFRALTSNWSKYYKPSTGTQIFLVNIVAPDHGIIFNFDYPDYIVDEFLTFIGTILDGQTGSHIDDVVQQLTDFPTYLPRHALSVKVLNAIRLSQASSL